jgi:hypothetical protein
MRMLQHEVAVSRNEKHESAFVIIISITLLSDQYRMTCATYICLSVDCNPHTLMREWGELEVVEVGSESGRGLDGRVFEVVVCMVSDAARGKAEQGGDVAVGNGRAVPAAAGAIRLGNRGASAFVSREAATALLTLGVIRAINKDRFLQLLGF